MGLQDVFGQLYWVYILLLWIEYDLLYLWRMCQYYHFLMRPVCFSSFSSKKLVVPLSIVPYMPGERFNFWL